MQPWTSEDGTLWALEMGEGLPPRQQARIDAAFHEAGAAEAEALAAAMGVATPEHVRLRLQEGRRCFVLRLDGEIVTYGWLTHGPERVGELEREFNLAEDEVYIWDCATRPEWRGQGCYSALLSAIIYRLDEEREERSVSRIWIGSSQRNQPSIQGFANAGFQRILDLRYRRALGLTLMWLSEAADARQELVSAGRRVILNGRERRIGPLVVGIKR